jgi:hypothetical protein
MSKRYLTLWSLLLCALMVWIEISPISAQTPSPAGVIAYVRPGGKQADQIRLINPDGTNDRPLWTAPTEDPSGIFQILSLDWRPDATELAFSSNHERACSIYESDMYSVRPDGTNFRRVGNGPDCASLANFPKGNVTVTVRNATSKFSTIFYLYVQGAPGVIEVTIPWNGTVTVTFPDVADFGAVQQQVAVLQNEFRWYVGNVDVQAGQTVTANPNPAIAWGDGNVLFGAWGPTWRSDGSRIGYARSGGNCRSTYAIRAGTTEPAAQDEPILHTDTIAPCSMAWAPTTELADKVIFAANPNLGRDGATFYLAQEGSNASNGVKLFSIGSTNALLWYDWAPDGKSFLFVRTTKFGVINYVESNLFEYNFATGEITQITQLNDEFVRSFNVSPDGEWIVFARAATIDSENSDLWIMRRDGSNLRLLVKNGHIPNWGSPPPAAPPVTQQRLFLPAVQR